MKNSLVERLDEVLTEFWANSPANVDIEKKLDSAIGAYLLARNLPEGGGLASVLLHPLIFAAEDLAKVRGQDISTDTRREGAPMDLCCFCGKKPSSVDLAAGPNVTICRDCVAILHGEFGSRKPDL